MLMEAKYLEITLVMHFKCYIGGKGENLSDRTFVRVTKLFCVLCLGAVHKLRYAIEVGGWLVKYNH